MSLPQISPPQRKKALSQSKFKKRMSKNQVMPIEMLKLTNGYSLIWNAGFGTVSGADSFTTNAG
jgi:hypothetical protein